MGRLPEKRLCDEALQELTAEYPSHRFVIDRDEASERLFKNVAPLEPAEQLLVDALGEVAVDPLDEVMFRRYAPRATLPFSWIVQL